MANVVKVDGERPGLGNPPIGPWLDGVPGDKGHLAWGQGGVGGDWTQRAMAKDLRPPSVCSAS